MSDEMRDPRLQAALRHAPDADLAPPSGLDRQILSAARQAVAAPPWWQRAWQLLLQPQGAAAFASLVLGTSVVLMWRGEVPPEAMPGSTAPQEVSTPPSADSAKAAAQPSAPAPLVVAQAPAQPAVATKVPAATPTPPKADTRLRSEPPPRQTPTAERRAAAAPAPEPAFSPAVVPTPAPAPAPPPPPPPPPPSPVLAEAAPPPAAPTPPTQRADAGPALGQAQGRPMPAPPAAMPAPPAAMPARKAAEAMASRAAAPAGLVAEPPIADLSRYLRGPWLRREAREMPRLQTLLRDAQGATLGALAFDDSGVWWRPWINGEAVPWSQRAALDGADAAELRRRYPVEMKPPE